MKPGDYSQVLQPPPLAPLDGVFGGVARAEDGAVSKMCVITG